jgi:hypothetical protein
MQNELDHLLAQRDPAIPLNDTNQASLNAEFVSNEMVNELLYVPMISDPVSFINQLRESLATINRLDHPLEIADLANEIGLLLGRVISNKAVLERDFQQGFSHGVDLAYCEIHDK